MSTTPRFTDTRYKLKQLILYIADRMQDAEFFGATKLNKVLYRSEFAAFRELGHKLTTFDYRKNKKGPTLRAFQPVTGEMEQEGLLAWEMLPQGGWEEQRPRALVAADLRVITNREKAVVDREIEIAWHLTATQMSEEEHQTAAWFAVRMNETVRPELSFVEDPGVVISLSDAEQQRAAAAIDRYLARTGRSANSDPRA